MRNTASKTCSRTLVQGRTGKLKKQIGTETGSMNQNKSRGCTQCLRNDEQNDHRAVYIPNFMLMVG